MVWLRQLSLLIATTGFVLVAGAQDVSTSEMERQKLDALRQENRYLQQRLREREDELDRGSTSDLSLRRQRDQAIQEGLNLRETLDRRETEMETMRNALAELREVESRNRQLEGQLERARLRHQQQAEALNSLRPALEELNQAQTDLAARDRQNRNLELALKGAEHQAATIAQLQANRRAIQSRLDLLYEERDAALSKVHAAADELNRLRGAVQEAEAAQQAAEAARAEATAAMQIRTEQLHQLEAAMTDAEEDATRYRTELNAERDELIAAIQAIQGERDALVGKLSEMKGLEADFEASSQARMQAERRAAGAEAEALRAAGQIETSRARADALAARVAALEAEGKGLRESMVSKSAPVVEDLNAPVQP